MPKTFIITENDIETAKFIFEYVDANQHFPRMKHIGEHRGTTLQGASWRVKHLVKNSVLIQKATGFYFINPDMPEMFKDLIRNSQWKNLSVAVKIALHSQTNQS